jgi:hypothetical protein
MIFSDTELVVVGGYTGSNLLADVVKININTGEPPVFIRFTMPVDN